MLFILGTPIGNLKDITERGRETLKDASFVICEDTRVTGKLLFAYGIKKSMVSLSQHATDSHIRSVLSRIRSEGTAVYVSDAGTPGINDPGGRLVALAGEAGIPVTPIPGVSALTTGISVCGFPMERFLYLGFAPTKKGRARFFTDLDSQEDGVVFFESTHRLLKALDSLVDALEGTRLICVCREMTKLHESIYRGTAKTVKSAMEHSSVKGEATIIIAPKRYRDPSVA